jgi:endoglucanase
MDGGTCESTAFYAYGYPSTGICVALGNYHNMDTKHERIASEYISLGDWENMVDWFEALAVDPKGYGSETQNLRALVDQRYESLSPMLHA